MDILEFKAEQIPPAARQACPLKPRFGLARIRTSCLGCPHYQGFVEVSPKATKFEDRYRALCGYPTARQIVMVDED